MTQQEFWENMNLCLMIMRKLGRRVISMTPYTPTSNEQLNATAALVKMMSGDDENAHLEQRIYYMEGEKLKELKE